MDYRTEKDGNLITIWDDGSGVGLQFTQGETLQRYTSNVLINDSSILSTQQGVSTVSKVQEQLTEYAAQHYPKEFEEINQ